MNEYDNMMENDDEKKKGSMKKINTLSVNDDFVEKVNETDTYIKASSARELTGLIPALPDSEAELEAYEELYPFLIQAKNQSEES
jgi:hypothetical protein